MPKQGVQYVVGTPAQTPVLRPLRQPLYDTEIYPAAGARQIELFVDRSNFAGGGAAKSENDTNMSQDGMLGTPLEFDLVGFTQEYERGISQADHNMLYNNGVFEWIFGQSTSWLQIRDTRIPEGGGSTGALDGAAAGVAQLSNGWQSTKEFYNFTTPDKRARRVTSNESFRCRKLYPAAVATPSTNTVRVTVYMLGILYGQL